MEHDVRVAGGTSDIETGQLLIIERCLCHIAFCNYKCLNISLFHKRAVFFFIHMISVGIKSCMLTVVLFSILQLEFFLVAQEFHS